MQSNDEIQNPDRCDFCGHNPGDSEVDCPKAHNHGCEERDRRIELEASIKRIKDEIREEDTNLRELCRLSSGKTPGDSANLILWLRGDIVRLKEESERYREICHAARKISDLVRL